MDWLRRSLVWSLITSVWLLVFGGCAVNLKNGGKIGFGVRMDNGIFIEHDTRNNESTAELDVKPLVDHIVRLRDKKATNTENPTVDNQ